MPVLRLLRPNLDFCFSKFLSCSSDQQRLRFFPPKTLLLLLLISKSHCTKVSSQHGMKNHLAVQVSQMKAACENNMSI